ncbi:PAR1 domain-containing protein [Cephalotus follicularis]|uniref:PAR1 domain-containing protein n=1 Tax=Cephalotus follicularis TaxID=3775 RepID=A0A1Q3D7L7_CEPFO|nr:PAR1 domain-containing protein [Cephalotus follicularis]
MALLITQYIPTLLSREAHYQPLVPSKEPMASNSNMKTFSVLALSLTLFIQVTLGEIITCENLNEDTCAFAISSSGKRCLLEKHVKRNGKEAYTCHTSEIEADNMNNLIETDQCIKACGLDRKSLGLSSDSLLESLFMQKLCSPRCYQSCPNIVDLYFSLAAGEGVFLPKLCEAQGANVRRGMSEIRNSGFAPGPIHSVKYLAAPGPIHSVKYLAAPGPIHSVKYLAAPGPVQLLN